MSRRSYIKSGPEKSKPNTILRGMEDGGGGEGGGANEHTLLMQQTNFVTERARHDRYSQENSCETVDTGEESISISAIKETDHRVTIEGRNEI